MIESCVARDWQRFTEVLTDVIVPSHLRFAEMFSRYKHLCDFPSKKAMSQVFVLSGIDWDKFLTVEQICGLYTLHADGWVPLLKRFAAGKPAFKPAHFTRLPTGTVTASCNALP